MLFKLSGAFLSRVGWGGEMVFMSWKNFQHLKKNSNLDLDQSQMSNFLRNKNKEIDLGQSKHFGLLILKYFALFSEKKFETKSHFRMKYQNFHLENIKMGHFLSQEICHNQYCFPNSFEHFHYCDQHHHWFSSLVWVFGFSPSVCPSQCDGNSLPVDTLCGAGEESM